MSRAARLLPLLLPLLPACGGGPAPLHPGPGLYRRLELTRPDPAPPAGVEAVRSVLPPEEGLGDWSAEDGELAAQDIGDGKGGQVRAVLVQGEGPKRILVPGTFDPAEFNQVLLHVQFWGKRPEALRVGFRFEGRNVLAAPWVSVPPRGRGPKVVPFDFPQLRRLKIRFDELFVHVRGESGPLAAVTRLDLTRVPLGGFLPARDGLGELVAVEGELRRAVGLSSAEPLAARFEVPEGARLAFSYGMLDTLRVPGERPRLVLRVRAEEGGGSGGSRGSGGSPLVRRFPLESGRRETLAWHEAEVDLGAFAGRAVEARFELEVRGGHEGFCAVAEAALTRRGREAPTVLLVTSDTHRGDHVGFGASGALELPGDGAPGAPEPPVRTPVLDALAARGVAFHDAYSSTNVTNPSHIALMTATSPRDTRILNNATPLAEQALTLAERFQAAGWRTFASVSAYHLLHDESGLGQGFERMAGPPKNDRDGAESVADLERWLGAAEGQPLFVWLHLFDAHSPYTPPEGFDRRYYPADVDPFDPARVLDVPERAVPPFLRGLTDRDFPYQQYRAEVDYVDSLMGRVLGHERFTRGVVAFTADHGESFGEHGIWWDHADLYPESVHVPLVLAWPGGPQGARSDAPVRMIDVGRTLLDLAGLAGAEFPGRNLSWALEPEPAAEPRFLLSAHGFVASVQDGEWLLMLHLLDHHETAIEERREAHQVELYHLTTDPGCRHDLALDPEHHARAVRLRRLLVDWLRAAPAEGLGTSKLHSAHAMESLEALGYAGEGGVGLPAEEGSALYVEDPESEWVRRFADD